MSKDTIYRDDAIKAIINKPAWHGSDGSYYHGDDIRDALKGLPSADRPQWEWTYCSERMPTETGAYLCLTEIQTVIAYRHIKIGVYHDINGWMLDDVIAWMPLPKLWEGADDGKDI